MDFSSTRFPLVIVSTDTTALREISWALSEHGYQGVPYSDWSEQALWRRMSAPGLVILDARDQQHIQAALAESRSTPYVYRVALYDPNLLGNPDMLVDLGADDLLRFPLVGGELVSILRRGERRLEFEKRFALSTTFDQQSGVANRRGFTIQLDRLLLDKENKSNYALAILGIDFLETIRERHGFLALEKACSLVAEVIHEGLSPQDCRGLLDKGVFAVLLHGQSLAEAKQFAQEANDRIAATIGTDLPISLSGVTLNWPSGDKAEVTIRRAMTALDHVRGWGGNQIHDLKEVELEHSTWKRKFTAAPAAEARNVMEPLPLVLPLSSATSTNRLGVYSFTAGQVPPCVPVVDDVGHFVGVIDGEIFKNSGPDVFNALEEYLEPAPSTLRGDSHLDDITAALESSDKDYLLVIDNKKPIGFVTHETLAAYEVKAGGDSSDLKFASASWGLSSLVVPLN